MVSEGGQIGAGRGELSDICAEVTGGARARGESSPKVSGSGIPPSTMWGKRCPVVANKLPDYLKEKIPELQKLLTELADVRGPAFYGYGRGRYPGKGSVQGRICS